MLGKDEIERIANEVVKELGSDYGEKIYQDAFLVELRLRGYQDYDREREIPVTYKNQHVGIVRADVVVRKGSEEVVLELKVGSDDGIKQKIKNELRAYLRALGGRKDGMLRKGFVVMFPETAGTKDPELPASAAVVEEIPTYETCAQSAA